MQEKSEPIQEKIRPRDFKFLVEKVDVEKKKVIVYDGADEYVFSWGDNKPVAVSEPYPKRGLSKEKWSALIELVSGIFRDRILKSVPKSQETQ